MRQSQTLMLEMSEHRSTLGAAVAVINAAAEAGNDPPEERVAEADKLTRDIRTLEVRYRTALLAEEEEDRKAADGDPNAEGSKLAALESRVSVAGYMAEAGTGKDAAGAEAEYRAELMGDAAAAGYLPIRLLATPEVRHFPGDRTEHRAVTPVAADAIGLGSQADILPRIFQRSVAGALGVAMPTVPMGVRTWPTMTAGTSATMQEPGGEQGAEAGAFTGRELGPKRLTGSYEFRVEDMQLLRGLEDTLRRDLRMVISDQMDFQIIQGDAAGANVGGFMSGVAHTGIADPAAPGAGAFDYDDFRAAFTAGVDGFYSYMLGDIRAVIGPGTYGRCETRYRANNTDDTVYAVMARQAGGLRVARRMPASDAGKVEDAIFSRAAFPGTTAVAPVWEAVQLIRDPYTKAQSGEVRITMLMLWNFAVIRAAAFYRRQFRNAA